VDRWEEGCGGVRAEEVSDKSGEEGGEKHRYCIGCFPSEPVKGETETYVSTAVARPRYRDRLGAGAPAVAEPGRADLGWAGLMREEVDRLGTKRLVGDIRVRVRFRIGSECRILGIIQRQMETAAVLAFIQGERCGRIDEIIDGCGRTISDFGKWQAHRRDLRFPPVPDANYVTRRTDHVSG
jgi:hypothetical protein